VEHLGHPARQRNLHQRDGERLAAGQFFEPVSITANTTYVASYHTNTGEYSFDANYFANPHTNGPLTAPSSASSGGNGVYRYGSSNLFPNNTFNANNYWVDVVFNSQ
jgi:hypothetical protein